MCHVWITGGNYMWYESCTHGRLWHNAVARHDDEYLPIKSIWRIPPRQVQRVSKERGRMVGSGLSFCSLGFKKKQTKKTTPQTSRLSFHHGWNDVHQTVKSTQVTVLSVALHPRCPVGQFLPLGKRSGFPKIYHPHLGPSRAVVDE